jgi:hypothetical protein
LDVNAPMIQTITKIAHVTFRATDRLVAMAIVEQKMPLIREAMRRDCNSQQQERETEAKPKTAAQARKDECRERRLKRYNETIEMYNRGMSQAEICRATGMEKKTVRRFLQAGVFPERAGHDADQRNWTAFNLICTSAGVKAGHNATQLWREIKSNLDRILSKPFSCSQRKHCQLGWKRHRAQHSVPFIDLQPDCVAMRRRLQPPCHSPGATGKWKAR